MKARALHSVICTKKLKETINFYEDYFNFEVYFESNTYAHLKSYHNDERDTSVDLAIMDVAHPAAPANMLEGTANLMLFLYTDDLEGTYDHLYMEGVTLNGEIRQDKCGKSYFSLQDPNGVTIVLGQAGQKCMGNLIEEGATSQVREFATA